MDDIQAGKVHIVKEHLKNNLNAALINVRKTKKKNNKNKEETNS